MISFNELPLSQPLIRAISDLGFDTPSPIQEQALPHLLGEPTDFLGLAATGTGKTAAFALPLLNKIDENLRAVQALVLCPTRELALQVMRQFEALGRYQNIQSLCVYGGAAYGPQLQGLKQGAQIVVGTPGRVVDLIEKGRLQLDQVHTFILDEADEMISMGFKEDLEKVLDQIPRETSNIWLFSATMGPRIRGVADKYLVSPKQVQINKTEMLPSQIHQYYFITKESNKAEVLCKLMDFAQNFYGIVFCQTKQMVMDLTQYLTERGYRADSLHGDKSQEAREHSMQAFRQRKLDVLVCTDVASRGLDVNDVTHVINHSIPRETDSYIHRIGRTGRSGKTGIALSLITPKQRGRLKQIEKLTRTVIKEGRVPSRKEIGIKKLKAYRDQFEASTSFGLAESLLDQDWLDSLERMSKPEIAGRFLSLIFPEIFSKEARSQGEPHDSRKSTVDEHGMDVMDSPSGFIREEDERRDFKPRFKKKGQFAKGNRRREDRPSSGQDSRGDSRPNKAFRSKKADQASDGTSFSSSRPKKPFRAKKADQPSSEGTSEPSIREKHKAKAKGKGPNKSKFFTPGQKKKRQQQQQSKEW